MSTLGTSDKLAGMRPPEGPQPVAAVRLIPVAFIVCNIAGLYSIYTFLHLIPMIQEPRTHERGLTEAVIFNIIVGLMLFCYIRCILTSPGGIPDRSEDPSWEYIGEDGRPSAGNGALRETKRDGQRRHCKWCAKYKPDRCHHCRVCRTCVLKMDHHCPWIYNCVGFRNHKFFFLLLFYACLCCHFITWTMMETVSDHIGGGDTIDHPSLRGMSSDPGDGNASKKTFMSLFWLLFGETLAAFIGILVTTPFFLFHVYLMLKGMTTIEFCEKSATGDSSSSYSLGFCGNIRAVLGDRCLLWCLPCSAPSGSGLFFPEREDQHLVRKLEADRGGYGATKRPCRQGGRRSGGGHAEPSISKLARAECAPQAHKTPTLHYYPAGVEQALQSRCAGRSPEQPAFPSHGMA